MTEENPDEYLVALTKVEAAWKLTWSGFMAELLNSGQQSMLDVASRAEWAAGLLSLPPTPRHAEAAHREYVDALLACSEAARKEASNGRGGKRKRLKTIRNTGVLDRMARAHSELRASLEGSAPQR